MKTKLYVKGFIHYIIRCKITKTLNYRNIIMNVAPLTT
jgi:hypothetical protein